MKRKCKSEFRMAGKWELRKLCMAGKRGLSVVGKRNSTQTTLIREVTVDRWISKHDENIFLAGGEG